jgi:hypothetical protein
MLEEDRQERNEKKRKEVNEEKIKEVNNIKSTDTYFASVTCLLLIALLNC